MTLSEFIKNLQKLEAEGHGEKDVYCRHGSSGACFETGSVHVTNKVSSLGPFGLAKGEAYVSIYVGN